MDVYEFEYCVDYGTGIAIIAAPSVEEAKELADGLSTGFGYWRFRGLIKDLKYSGEPQVIIHDSYVE